MRRGSPALVPWSIGLQALRSPGAPRPAAGVRESLGLDAMRDAIGTCPGKVSMSGVHRKVYTGQPWLSLSHSDKFTCTAQRARTMACERVEALGRWSACCHASRSQDAQQGRGEGGLADVSYLSGASLPALLFHCSPPTSKPPHHDRQDLRTKHQSLPVQARNEDRHDRHRAVPRPPVCCRRGGRSPGVRCAGRGEAGRGHGTLAHGDHGRGGSQGGSSGCRHGRGPLVGEGCGRGQGGIPVHRAWGVLELLWRLRGVLSLHSCKLDQARHTAAIPSLRSSPISALTTVRCVFYVPFALVPHSSGRTATERVPVHIVSLANLPRVVSRHFPTCTHHAFVSFKIFISRSLCLLSCIELVQPGEYSIMDWLRSA
jgi:hypothetical protein